MSVQNIFKSLVGSEKAGQHLLVAFLVVLTSTLIVWWGVSFDQEGRITIIRMLMYACGLLIPFALGMAALQEIMSERLGGITIETSEADGVRKTVRKPVKPMPVYNMMGDGDRLEDVVEPEPEPDLAPVREPVAPVAPQKPAAQAPYQGGD